MTGSKPNAGNYKVVAQKILDEAIALYCGYLSTVMLYPGSMDEIRWANKSWKGGCDKCETEMKANDKITRMIHAHANCMCLPTDALCAPFLKITSCGSNFRGQIKTKV